jgi:hypothetical protein
MEIISLTRRIGAALMIVVCLAIGVPASAAPITWVYTGTVTSAFSQPFVPVGTPTTIALTVDPDANLGADLAALLGVTNMGVYAYSAAISFAGLDYLLTGWFEVNYDADIFGHAIVGAAVREGTLRGPSLDPNPPPPNALPWYYGPEWPLGCNARPCYWHTIPTDSTSPALPYSLATGISYFLWFNNPSTPGSPGLIRVSGTRVVPEPAPLALLLVAALSAVAAVVVRRRQRV